MTHIVILGAGLGGIIMAYEMKRKLRREDRLTVVNLGSHYSFVPSNPWIAVGWRKPDDITVDLVPVLKQRGIELRPEGAERIEPASNRIRLNGGDVIDYDYLVIATGPELAFDEVPGLGPAGFTQSVCQTDHALQAKTAFDALPERLLVTARRLAALLRLAVLLNRAHEDDPLPALELTADYNRLSLIVPQAFIDARPLLRADLIGETDGIAGLGIQFRPFVA